MSVIDQLHKVADIGYVYDFPFKDWKGSKYKDVSVGMRLLNSGELLEVAQQLERSGYSSGLGRTLSLQIATLARAIISWAGGELATQEGLEAFRKNAGNPDATLLDYKLYRLRELENVVIEQLDSMYSDLQQKQKRLVLGKVLCQESGEVYDREEVEGNPSIEWLDQKIAEIIFRKDTEKVEDDDSSETAE